MTSAGNMAPRPRATPTLPGCSILFTTWPQPVPLALWLANGSMSSSQSGEGVIRKSLIETDRVDCMVALPGQLFYSTQIPACLWFLARDRKGGKFRDRRGEVLFIDARKIGRMVDRTHRELTDEDITRIADTYHAWRGGEGTGD